MKKPTCKVIILEGARGVGKSSVARELRNQIPYITLINATGFPDLGMDGLLRSTKYYDGWVDFLLANRHTNEVFLFDRFMTSEKVYADLYKDYDFDAMFYSLLGNLTREVEVHIINMELDCPEMFQERLTRNKVPYADVQESVQESIRQQEGYQDLMQELASRNYPNLSITKCTVLQGDTPQIIAEELKERIEELIK